MLDYRLRYWRNPQQYTPHSHQAAILDSGYGGKKFCFFAQELYAYTLVASLDSSHNVAIPV